MARGGLTVVSLLFFLISIASPDSNPRLADLPILLDATLEQLAHGLDNGIFTSIDLTKAYLARIEEINAEITASNASPVGFLNITRALDPKKEMSRSEFYDQMMHHTSSHDQVVYGTPDKVADYLEEIFVATGEKGGFMIAHPPATPRDLLNVVDFLVPELQRRGRYRTEYTGTTMKDNLSN